MLQLKNRYIFEFFNTNPEIQYYRSEEAVGNLLTLQ